MNEHDKKDFVMMASVMITNAMISSGRTDFQENIAQKAVEFAGKLWNELEEEFPNED